MRATIKWNFAPNAAVGSLALFLGPEPSIRENCDMLEKAQSADVEAAAGEADLPVIARFEVRRRS
jgi:hypothetical protein